jgi:hypothetical protein
MRNILTIAGLSTEAANPAETVEWINKSFETEDQSTWFSVRPVLDLACL